MTYHEFVLPTLVKGLMVTGLLPGSLYAQALPVVPMQMDPDQLARSLRDHTPVMPAADCKALRIGACYPGDPSRVSDMWLRWVQMDNDGPLEAVLVTEAPLEHAYMAYVFDKQQTWRMVGDFRCNRSCDADSLIRVQKLTRDSPPLILCHRDLGGSGQVLRMTEAFQLREGRLWPVLEVKNFEGVPFMSPRIERQHVYASETRLVIHTAKEEPPGTRPRHQCEVRRWSAAQHRFVKSPTDQAQYCDPRTGKPVAAKLHWTGLRTYP